MDITNIKEMLSQGRRYKITWKPLIFQIIDGLTKTFAGCDCLFSITSINKYYKQN